MKGLIDNMRIRHQNLNNIRPIEELLKYVNDTNKNLTTFSLPQLDYEILFTIQAEIRVDNEMIIVKFKIPMFNPSQFDENAIISSPAIISKDITNLGNNQIIRNIAMNKKNSTMFFPDQAIEMENNMFINVTMEIITPWITAIFAIKRIEEIKGICTSQKAEIFKDNIYWLNSSRVVVMLSTVPSIYTKLFCGEEEVILESKVSIIPQ